MKKGVLIAAVILLLIGLGVFASAYIASGGDLSSLSAVKTETRTYTVSEDFSAIDIETLETDIVIVPSENGGSSVVCVENEKTPHSVRVENGTLKITAEDGRSWIDKLGFSVRALKMTVYLPAGEYDELTIVSRTGDVAIDKSFAFTDVSVTASTGDVACEASASGAVSIATSTGDIKLENMSAADIALSVSTGRVKASDIVCGGAFTVSVSTGRAELDSVACASLVSTGSTGDIKLKNVVVSGRIDIERNTGDISFESCDASELMLKTTTGRVKGTLLTEKVFIAKSSTGSVKVPDTVSGGRCEVSTSTGDIEIGIAGR